MITLTKELQQLIQDANGQPNFTAVLSAQHFT